MPHIFLTHVTHLLTHATFQEDCDIFSRLSSSIFLREVTPLTPLACSGVDTASVSATAVLATAEDVSVQTLSWGAGDYHRHGCADEGQAVVNEL
jgi:hypothetical protein